jgi:hypothetical protein
MEVDPAVGVFDVIALDAEVSDSGMGRSGTGGEKPPAKPEKWVPGE